MAYNIEAGTICLSVQQYQYGSTLIFPNIPRVPWPGLDHYDLIPIIEGTQKHMDD
jgi:hypothetical protein